jgi:hypothetical protein
MKWLSAARETPRSNEQILFITKDNKVLLGIYDGFLQYLYSGICMYELDDIYMFSYIELPPLPRINQKKRKVESLKDELEECYKEYYSGDKESLMRDLWGDEK